MRKRQTTDDNFSTQFHRNRGPTPHCVRPVLLASRHRRRAAGSLSLPEQGRDRQPLGRSDLKSLAPSRSRCGQSLEALSGTYAAIVAAGLVVDGGIYRHEFVATAVISGLMNVQLETGVPLFSAVLTPQDFLGQGQPEFFKAHFVTKGIEAAQACIGSIGSLNPG